MMPQLAAEWDSRLDRAIRKAADEARDHDNPALADMLTEFRLAMSAWRDISLSRLRALGIVSMTEEEHNRVMQLIADATAVKVVEEAKAQVQQRHDAWWERRSVRVTVVVGVAGVVLSTLGTTIALFALLLRH